MFVLIWLVCCMTSSWCSLKDSEVLKDGEVLSKHPVYLFELKDVLGSSYHNVLHCMFNAEDASVVGEKTQQLEIINGQWHEVHQLKLFPSKFLISEDKPIVQRKKRRIVGGYKDIRTGQIMLERDPSTLRVSETSGCKNFTYLVKEGLAKKITLRAQSQ